MDPRHVGVRVKAADAAAKQPPAAPASHARAPTYSIQARETGRSHCAHQTHRELEPGRGRRPGTLQPPTTPHWTHPAHNQRGMAHYAGVCVWLLHQKELQETSGAMATTRDAPVAPVHSPVLPRHRPPEAPRPPPPSPQWGAAEWRKAAALSPPHPEDVMLGVLRAGPSPLTHHLPTPCRAPGTVTR
ncbi:hypothetical protein GWK47_049090 [Chionoecetes opilio]|uniref:Uncharacterized protein n=1 Tax=Chionoecetes opilio TaxID=41210 RepID=A0A8J5CUD4_CHIOP|nr:hypothetical protein GWK47_049090 [Chionoecetes opilio]